MDGGDDCKTPRMYFKPLNYTLKKIAKSVKFYLNLYLTTIFRNLKVSK